MKKFKGKSGVGVVLPSGNKGQVICNVTGVPDIYPMQSLAGLFRDAIAVRWSVRPITKKKARKK